jgi:hypothetical protein
MHIDMKEIEEQETLSTVQKKRKKEQALIRKVQDQQDIHVSKVISVTLENHDASSEYSEESKKSESQLSITNSDLSEVVAAQNALKRQKEIDPRRVSFTSDIHYAALNFRRVEPFRTGPTAVHDIIRGNSLKASLDHSHTSNSNLVVPSRRRASRRMPRAKEEISMVG